MARSVTVSRAAKDKAGHSVTFTNSFTVNDVSTLPQVQPLQALKVYQNLGMVTHPNFGNEVYKWSAEVVERVASIGAHKQRGMYPSNAALRDANIAACRARGVKWLAAVAVVGDTQAQVNAKVDHMAANAADVIWGTEGVNEPNPSGTGSSWVPPVAEIQRWTWERVKSKPSLAGIRVCGPAMHDKNLDGVNGLHWKQWTDYRYPDNGKSVLDYMDTCSIHCYAGDVPLNKWDERNGWVSQYFGPSYPRIITEYGFFNALGQPREGGHVSMSEAASAVYDIQEVLEFAKIGVPICRNELLNDPNPGNNVDEANSGLWRVTGVDNDPDATWTPKPAVDLIAPFQAWCKADTGAAVSPVSLSVTAPTDVHWALIGRADGQVRIYMWRYGRVWDPATEQPIALGSVVVTVTDNAGARTVNVGPTPTYLDVRQA